MKIDAHQHFWVYDRVRDSWIDDTMEVIRKDFLPSDLAPIYKKNGIDGCVAVQADQSEKETMFLLEQANGNPFIKGVVGWVDLLSENVEERLAYFSQNKKLKGIRHIVQAESNEFMLRTDFQNGIGKLQKYELTYDILVFPTQLPAAIKLVQKFSEQYFVLDHIGKPYIKEGKIKNWKRDIEILAKYPNVYCKISGMFTEADWKNWNEKDFLTYLDVVFDSFGVNRVLYGSDWPVCLLAASYKEQLKFLESYIKKFSALEREKIMGGNALEFYNLNI
jgi:L-fuconolactonase